MAMMITVDGIAREVTNSRSSGPEARPHEYELRSAAGDGWTYVQQIGDRWQLCEPGHAPRVVSVVEPALQRYRCVIKVGRKRHVWTRFAPDKATARERLAKACANEFEAATWTIELIAEVQE